MRDALVEEILLLAHDLACYLDDGFLPLVERLHQPVGAGKTVCEPAFGRFALCPTGQFDIIDAVDEDARQGRRVYLARPAVLGRVDEQGVRETRGARSCQSQAEYG